MYLNARNITLKNDMNNPVSPTSTKSLLEKESGAEGKQNNVEPPCAPVVNPDTNMLSMTIKAKDNILSKDSGTIDGSSYNSLMSHQSKSFSNTK